MYLFAPLVLYPRSEARAPTSSNTSPLTPDLTRSRYVKGLDIRVWQDKILPSDMAEYLGLDCWGIWAPNDEKLRAEMM